MMFDSTPPTPEPPKMNNRDRCTLLTAHGQRSSRCTREANHGGDHVSPMTDRDRLEEIRGWFEDAPVTSKTACNIQWLITEVERLRGLLGRVGNAVYERGDMSRQCLLCGDEQGFTQPLHHEDGCVVPSIDDALARLRGEG